MNITTDFGIGDCIWGVRPTWETIREKCKSCDGAGGAHIPSTKMWIKCEDCSGDGETEQEVEGMRVFETTVERISITVSRYRTEIKYHYPNRGPDWLHGAFETKDAAEAWIDRVNRRKKMVDDAYANNLPSEEITKLCVAFDNENC